MEDWKKLKINRHNMIIAKPKKKKNKEMNGLKSRTNSNFFKAAFFYVYICWSIEHFVNFLRDFSLA